MSSETATQSSSASANPYEPTTTDETPRSMGWIALLWNILLLTFLGVLLWETVDVMAWHISQHPDSPTFRDVVILLARLSHVLQGTLFFGLVALSLTSMFFRPVGRWWRSLYLVSALLILCDPMLLVPSLESVLGAAVFVVLVLPVFLRGYGWIGAALELGQWIKKRRTLHPPA